MDFFTMGMFILDDIVYQDGTKQTGVIGGAGIYAVQSAGFFLKPQDRKKSVGMIIDTGTDFSPQLKKTIDSWSLNILWRHNENRLTTRGLNTYLDNDTRDFEYLSPKIQITSDDLLETGELAKSIHLICSPIRALEFCRALGPRFFIWEPVPFNCTPDDLPGLEEMFEFARVISPNAKEAAGFLGKPEPVTKQEIEAIADAYHEYKGILVIRCGALGSLLVHDSTKTWFNAYHLDSKAVIDPTGGGNSFMGGLGIALARNPKDIVMAIVYATVAAGLQIEQLGPAVYDPETDKWNGDKVAERVDKYIIREGIVSATPYARS